MIIFNERLRALRDENNLTSKMLAKDLGISESKLSYYMGGRGEPPYDLLIQIANRFNVSTDYLTGRTNQKSYDEIQVEKNIKNSSDLSITNSERKADIEQLSVQFYELLVKFSNNCNDPQIWEMIKTWIDGLAAYYEFAAKYQPHQYPLDEAKNAMDTLSHANHLAAKEVGKMIKEVLSDETVDKDTKGRIIIEQSFGIKPNKTAIDKK